MRDMAILVSNRKSHRGFRLVPILMTLNDLEPVMRLLPTILHGTAFSGVPYVDGRQHKGTVLRKTCFRENRNVPLARPLCGHTKFVQPTPVLTMTIVDKITTIPIM